jgi:hypothetical protein
VNTALLDDTRVRRLDFEMRKKISFVACGRLFFFDTRSLCHPSLRLGEGTVSTASYLLRWRRNGLVGYVGYVLYPIEVEKIELERGEGARTQLAIINQKKIGNPSEEMRFRAKRFRARFGHDAI